MKNEKSFIKVTLALVSLGVGIWALYKNYGDLLAKEFMDLKNNIKNDLDDTPAPESSEHKQSASPPAASAKPKKTKKTSFTQPSQEPKAKKTASPAKKKPTQKVSMAKKSPASKKLAP